MKLLQTTLSVACEKLVRTWNIVCHLPAAWTLVSCYKALLFVKIWGDGGGGHSLVQMGWRLAGWSVCLPLLIFPCTIKSRSSLLAPAHLGGPGKRAVKRLWCGGVVQGPTFVYFCGRMCSGLG